MYAHFYHLAECPFNLTPDPKFHYVNESTQEAMASLLYGIESRKGFLTLIGEAGTGKTTLLKRVVEEVEGDALVVFVFNPGVTFDELLEYICTELGIPVENCRRLNLLERLNEFLLDQLTAGKNVVVMIDEAQTLGDAVLEELRLLSNLETSKEKIIQILLSGQPELAEKLRKPSLRQLRQRIGTRAVLKPMLAKEIGPYIETRLRSAGSDEGQIFTNKAMRTVWRCSGGIARVVNVICDNAMMIAFAEGRKRVNAKVVKEAIQDLDGVQASTGKFSELNRWLAIPAVRMAGAAAVAVLVAVPFAMSLLSSDRERVAAVERPTDAAREVIPQANRADGAPLGTQVAAVEAPRDGILVDRLPGPAGTVAGNPVVDDDFRRMPLASNGNERVATESMSDRILRDTIRRAEVLARSTAARLYAEHHENRLEQREVISNPDRSRPRRAVAREVIATASVERERHDIAAPAPVSARSIARTPPANPSRQESVVTAAPQAAVESTRVRSTEPTVKSVKASAAPLVVNEPPAPAVRGLVVPSPAESVRETETIAMADTSPEKAPVVERVNSARGVASSAPQAAIPPKVVRHTQATEPRPAPVAKEVVEVVREEPKPEPAAVPVEVASIAPASVVPAQRVGKRARVVLGPARGYPLVGHLVGVADGDTVWDIAVKYYGYAGPRTLEAILDKNPQLRNPRRLIVGDQLYLPFLKAVQMVRSAPDGSYSVLISSSPTQKGVSSARDWVGDALPELELRSGTGQGEATYVLYASGFTSKQAALGAADKVLLELSERDRSGRRRRADAAYAASYRG